MNCIKKSFFIFLLLFGLFIKYINNIPIENKLDKSFSNNPRDEKITDQKMEVLNELKEKTQSEINTNTILKTQKEIYKIYIYFLLFINIIFTLIISIYSIYKFITYYNKNKNKNKKNNLSELKQSHANENDFNLIIKSSLKENNFSFDENRKRPSNEEELLNDSGIEAPTVDKYYTNTNF